MLVFLIATAAGFFVGWLALHLELIPWRRSVDAHWTIRARQLFPVRVAGALNLWLLPLLCFPAAWVGWRTNSAAAAFGGFFGATLSGYLIDREVTPEISGRTWVHLALVTFVFRLLRWATFAAGIYFMPTDFNAQAWAIAGGFLLVVLGLEFGQGFRVLRWCGLLHPASPRLMRVVGEARAACVVPVRAIWELATPEANALAVTTTRELVFTRRLLDGTSDDELRAICVHELAHLAESRWTLIARIIGSLAVFPILFYRPVEAKFGPQGLIGLVAITAAAVWLRSRLSHRKEKHADRAAVTSAADSSAYARGLEAIYRLNRMPVVQRKSGLNTHPDLYDRMIAASVVPDYPRPGSPRGLAWSSTVLAAVCAWMVLGMVFNRP
jgi:Zn-dependent protease with chaperone function